jgi:hypothetical protein
LHVIKNLAISHAKKESTAAQYWFGFFGRKIKKIKLLKKIQVLSRQVKKFSLKFRSEIYYTDFRIGEE